MSNEKQINRPEERNIPSLPVGTDERGAGRELRAEIDGLRGDIQALEGSVKVWLVAAAIIQGVINPLIAHAILSGT